MDKRFDFLGVRISAINHAGAVEMILCYPFRSPGYISFPDASVVSDAVKDPLLKEILNNAWLTMPDGKPSQLFARLQGLKTVSTVSGFHLCNDLLKTQLTHYFYGGDEKGIEKLRLRLEQLYPHARILGYKCPPFLNKENIAGDAIIKNDISAINALKPDLVWVGISSPKQDYLMHYFHRNLDKSLMLGIGGAFLYFYDEKLKSPEWIKKIGLRWCYRLYREPFRLAPKYYGTFKFLFVNSGLFFRAAFRKKV